MIKWILLFLLFISFTATAQERGFVLWNKNQVNVNPWNKIDIEVSEKVHYSTTRSTLDLKYGDIFIGHQVFNWLKYGAGFRISYANLQNGDWLQENRPMLFADLGEDAGKFEFDLYNRFEYRNYKVLKNHFRYRHSFRIKFPAITDWGMQFYLQEEAFIKLNGDGAHLARVYSGLTALEKEHVEIRIYYALQKQELLNHWLTADIFGLNFSFNI
ncbi:DUF2490 domain-containing protein [uncultured Draconibacterium sp.]|uniref:DUF2490 domain-containing protein n=1 Tax=uncultured Draconibacterium sp. TaxID=1573823 RepID=UPI002AA8F489|nr:DUF2490 domain-containing protein [uncultured Draconibacterium sp.]